MSRRTCYIAINGIRTSPGDAEGWTDRFVTWVNTRLPDGVVAEKFEYYCSALLRRLRQRERADEIAKKVGYYRRAGYRIVLVGHSNGCDLIARVLQACGAEIDAAHLISPAADEEDFAEAIRDGLIRRIHIYGSRNDGALRFAKATRPLLGWLGLGYGSLGLRGSEFEALFPEVVHAHTDHAQGHSTWLQRGAPFEKLMRALQACDLSDQQTIQTPMKTKNSNLSFLLILLTASLLGLSSCTLDPATKQALFTNAAKDVLAGGGALLITGGNGPAAVAALSAQEVKNIEEWQKKLAPVTSAKNPVIVTAPAAVP